MRLVRISLAAKYRVLYGLAVLLIIGAALYLPWHQIEQLTWARPFGEAQRVAQDYFRFVLGVPRGSAGDAAARSSHDDTHAPPGTGAPPAADFTPLNVLEAADATAGGGFARRALLRFSRAASLDQFYDLHRSGGDLTLRYAAPVRVSERCLDCHGERGSARRYSGGELAGVITVEVPAQQAWRELLLNRALIVSAGILAGLLAMLVFYVITHRFILAPVDELRGVARRVTEGGTRIRAQLRTGDEFEQLADSFNSMLERLEASQDELRTANRSLDVKLGEMAESNVALFEANRVKNEFLANVSHELRTPLTSIIGFAELLRDSPAVEQHGKSVRYAENILISGRILLEIINDLLDLAKIEAGKVELRIESVQAGDVCRTLVDFLRPLSDKKRISLDCDVAPDLPAIQTDRGRLRQVLYNLLSNAIKFTPEDGFVRVRARRTAGGVHVSVADSGPGIDPAQHAVIFEKFRQIDGSATREHYGTGLGLPIARELVHLLGGQIGVHSELGQGATFWCEFPIEAPAAVQARAPVNLL